MAQIKLCEISGGKVANIALADDQNIPPHMEGPEWVPFATGATVGGTWDGSTFGPVPQADIDAAEAARVEAQVDRLQKQQKVLLSLIFEIWDRAAAAGVAGFPTLTNAEKRQYIQDRL